MAARFQLILLQLVRGGFAAWALILVVSFLVMMTTHLTLLLNTVITSNAPVLEYGRRNGNEYVVMSGKPFKPKVVSAAYWHTFRTIERVREVSLAILAIAFLIPAGAAYGIWLMHGSFELLRGRWNTNT